MFTLSLVEPQIPPNTGNISRLCAATGTRLELAGKLGFSIEDKQLKRAGLDYWKSVDLHLFPQLETYLKELRARRFFLFSTRGKQSYFQAKFQPGDTLVFGSETQGLPPDLLTAYPERVYRIPIDFTCVRSINLATATGIVLFEAIRQTTQPPYE